MSSHQPRLATPTDLPAIQSLIHAAYSPYIPLIGRPPGPMSADYLSSITASQLYVISSLDNTILGLINLIPLPAENALYLGNIAVAPEAQGMGVGRRLLEFAEERARVGMGNEEGRPPGGGFGEIRLHTNEKMERNLRIYEKRGYRETRRGEENGLRRVWMVKKMV